MNILVPHKWLLEHIDTNAQPKDIQRCLSLCGPSVERIYQRNGDYIYDIEITTNRVDSASVRGIAREAAAILPEFGFKTKLKTLTLPKPTHDQPLDLTIKNDPTLCHRIVAIKLSNVSVAPSPQWLQKRLIQVGQRPLNNLIDITNYVMWDLGHPVHVFDYDKFTQKKLIVRQAVKGEVILTLDHKKYITVGGEVVFDDGTNTIIDMPGIMGTHNTAVDDNTKNILFFIDSIKDKKIRFASMTHGIRSQAAILNEKNVDPELAMESLLSGIKLYQDIAHASVSSSIVDIYPNKLSPSITVIYQHQIDACLGLTIDKRRVIRILESLGCNVVVNKDAYKITPPSFRASDLNIKEDYFEEIARIYGYHNLPSVIMATAIPNHQNKEDFGMEANIKNWLSGWGCQEVYTYSMISKKLASQSAYPINAHIRIANPLTDEWVYMRRSLLASLKEVLMNHPDKPRVIFEMQNVYHPQPNSLPHEELRLGMLTNQPYQILKGMLDALMKKLFIKQYSVDETGNILIHDKVIGQVTYDGELSGVDMTVSQLISASHTHPTTLAMYQFPNLKEDLTFTLPEKMAVGPIINTIIASNALITKVDLKDIYHQNYTFTITYQSNQKNLATEDIAPIRKKIVTKLESQNIKLVGTLQ